MLETVCYKTLFNTKGHKRQKVYNIEKSSFNQEFNKMNLENRSSNPTEK